MKKIILLPVLFISVNFLFAQNVGIGTTTPDNSALLEIKSTSKGLLLPRMTTEQRNAIVAPVVGLMIFNLDDLCTDIFDGTFWIKNCGLKQTDSTNAPANSWVQKQVFGGTAKKNVAGFSIGNKAYIGTGNDGSPQNDFWEFDPFSNTWTQKANVGGLPRYAAIGFSIGSKGYIGTGIDLYSSYVKDFWEYDPSLNKWTIKADFGGTVRAYTIGFSIGAKGYVGTGNYGANRYKDFWEFDPSLNTWTQKTDFGGGTRTYAAGFSIGTKGYVGTGWNGGNYFNDFWQYDASLNTWTQKAAISATGRIEASGFSIGSKGYIGTGYTDTAISNNYLNDFWEYDPSLNSWTEKAKFGGAGRSNAIGFSIGTKGYIGTGFSGLYFKDFWEFNTTPTSYLSFNEIVPALSSSISDGIWTKTINSIYNNYNYKLSYNGNAEFSGNIGINTLASTYPLNFSNSVGDKISLYGNTPNAGHYGFGIQSGLLQIHSDAAAANIAFGYGSSSSFTERARIINTGADGMVLSGRLLIKNGTADANNTPGVYFYKADNSALLGYVGAQNNQNLGFYGGPLNFGLTYNTANSYVGIGNSNPTQPLSFSSSIGKKISFYQGGTGDYGMGVWSGELRLYTDLATGKVSFGVDNYSTGYTELGFFQRNSAYALSVLGSIWANSVTYASDERFKQNISSIQSPLQKLMLLNGVEYEMRKEAFPKNNFMPGRQIGLLAQNVEQVFPEAVSENADGYKGVDYARLVPLLIEAIKEISAQNTKLQKRLEILEKK